MNSTEQERFFWNLPFDALQAQLQLDPAGISTADAQARMMRFGPNVLQARGGNGLAIQYLRHFKNPLVLILLAASLISAFTGEITGFAIIWIIVLLSVTLDFYQEYRASQAAERLKQSVEVSTTVMRDGRSTQLPMSQLVPGDVVMLSAGDLMPGSGHD